MANSSRSQAHIDDFMVNCEMTVKEKIFSVQMPSCSRHALVMAILGFAWDTKGCLLSYPYF